MSAELQTLAAAYLADAKWKLRKVNDASVGTDQVSLVRYVEDCPRELMEAVVANLKAAVAVTDLVIEGKAYAGNWVHVLTDWDRDAKDRGNDNNLVLSETLMLLTPWLTSFVVPQRSGTLTVKLFGNQSKEQMDVICAGLNGNARNTLRNNRDERTGLYDGFIHMEAPDSGGGTGMYWSDTSPSKEYHLAPKERSDVTLKYTYWYYTERNVGIHLGETHKDGGHSSSQFEKSLNADTYYLKRVYRVDVTKQGIKYDAAGVSVKTPLKWDTERPVEDGTEETITLFLADHYPWGNSTMP